MTRTTDGLRGMGCGVSESGERNLQHDRVTQALNVWASVTFHRMMGGGGVPELKRCGLAVSLEREPEAIDHLPLTIDHSGTKGKGLGSRVEGSDAPRVCVRISCDASQAYDASFAKYKARGPRGIKVDKKTQEIYLTVCRCLRDVGNPGMLVGLLLWVYPTDGDLVVKRPPHWSADNPYRSFRPEKWVNATFGNVGHKYLDQSIDRMLMNAEAGFRAVLAVALGLKRMREIVGEIDH